MEYVQVFINSLSDRYQNTCQLVMHQKMMLLPASTPPPAAAAYLTWICAFAWRLTSAKIMREMWSSSSSNSRDRTLASLVSQIRGPGCPRRLWWRLTEL